MIVFEFHFTFRVFLWGRIFSMMLKMDILRKRKEKQLLKIQWQVSNPWPLCQVCLMLWVRIMIRARCTTLCEKVCQWLATGQWFSPSPGTPPVSSTNKADHHNITEILLKVALNTIEQTNKQSKSVWFQFEEHSISRLLYCLLNYLKLVFWLNSNCTWLIIRWSLTKS